MDPKTVRAYGAIAISVLTAGIFGAAFVIAYRQGDTTNITLLIGAIISQFSGVVSYWVGSSSSAQQKDETIAASVPPPAIPAPQPTPNGNVPH